MSVDLPPWEAPFVVTNGDVSPQRHRSWDLYDPDVEGVRPLIAFVHGGPIPDDLPASPRDWPVYRGYGALAARAGFVGLTVDHRLHSYDDFATAYQDVLDAIENARSDARVDGDRVAVWVFSGGGPMLAPLLASPPRWLRCVAASYPILDSRPGRALPLGFKPIESVEAVGAVGVPVTLTRVGLEAPETAAGVERFVSAAQESGLLLHIIDQPNGQHGFDNTDHTQESVDAVNAAVAAVAAALDR